MNDVVRWLHSAPASSPKTFPKLQKRQTFCIRDGKIMKYIKTSGSNLFLPPKEVSKRKTLSLLLCAANGDI